MPKLALSSYSQLQLVVASGLLVTSQITSPNVLGEQTNFPFYKILILLEVAQLALASYSQLQLVVACGLLVTSQTTSLNVLGEQTNFPFYKITNYNQLQLVVAYRQLISQTYRVSQKKRPLKSKTRKVFDRELTIGNERKCLW